VAAFFMSVIVGLLGSRDDGNRASSHDGNSS
jgi:hypothetical protein